jgi:hypothetical protein
MGSLIAAGASWLAANWGAVAATTAVAGTIASGTQQAVESHKQRKLQREANEKQEALQRAQAGAAPQQREAEAVAASEADRKSALRRTILTKSTSSGGTKLGD